MSAVQEKFAADVVDHELEVLHDDGLYRHLRFRKPGTSFYWFDLVTWPGNLTIRGDMGTFVFTRLEDMLTFFRGHPVNEKYWAEKVTAGGPIETYDADHAKTYVLDNLPDDLDDEPDLAGLRKALEVEVFEDCEFGHEHGARQLLDDFEHRGFRFSDTWEWDLKTYSYHYLWCLHAIVWGIGQYDQARKLVAA